MSKSPTQLSDDQPDAKPVSFRLPLSAAVSPEITERARDLRKKQGERLREARRKAGYTIEALAGATGMHFNTLGRIERGESEAALEQLLVLSEALETPLETLTATPAIADAGLSDDEFVLIDMLDVRVSAGGGAVNGAHEVIGRFAFRRAWLTSKGVRAEKARIIRARGDSMADQIKDGDILLVDTAVTQLEQDGVYVIEQEGLDYVKLLQRDFATGGIQILSYNAKYQAQRLAGDQVSELRISGRVIWRGGEL